MGDEEKKKKGERGCKLAPERRGIKMAFPKGCANLDKLYSGFSSSSLPSSPPPPPPPLLLLFLSSLSSSPGGKKVFKKRKNSRKGAVEMKTFGF